MSNEQTEVTDWGLDLNTEELPPLSLNAFPDEEAIEGFRKEFRFWHVESLLNQAAVLVDRCVADLAESKRLEMVEFTLKQELELTERELENHRMLLDREIIATQSAIDYQRAADGDYADSVREAETLENTVPNRMRIEEKYSETNERKSRFEALENSLRWLKQDRFDAEKLLSFRAVQLTEKQKQTEANGFLDIMYQSELCFSRLCRNYDDALKRALVAQEGMQKIYGSGLKLYLYEPFSSEPDRIQYSVSALYRWVYEAIEQVSAYSQLDQGFTVCLSLKSLLSDAEFEELKAAKDYHIVFLEIDRSNFPTLTHENIRLKGVGATLVGNVGAFPWSLNIGLPQSSYYARLPEGLIVSHQSRLHCTLGRVENRTSARSVEIGGAISLNNLSPLGIGSKPESQWVIEFEKPKSDSEKFSNIEDVVIELSLVGRIYVTE